MFPAGGYGVVKGLRLVLTMHEERLAYLTTLKEISPYDEAKH